MNHYTNTNNPIDFPKQEPTALHYAEALMRNVGSQLSVRKSAADELRRLHQSEHEGWRYAKELEARITALEAALRQAVKALEDIRVQNMGPKVSPAITAAKQALEK